MTTFTTKTLAAATLAALMLGAAGSAAAADMSIYGLIDTGLNYTRTDSDLKDADAESTFSQKSSQMIPSRWGMKGTENLGNGWHVAFNLEGQFSPDDGSMVGNRLFHRAAQVEVSGPYGKVVMGRSGMLRSGFGTTGIWAAKINPFSNSWGNFIAGSKYVMPGDFKSADNTVTYVSPAWSGLQLHAQYSMKVESVTAAVKDFEENSPETDRMWALGATYTAGNLHAVAIVDSILYGNKTKIGDVSLGKRIDDSFAASLGVTYDFGVLKLYASGMVFDNMLGSKFQGHDFGGVSSIDKSATYKGQSLQLGTDVPLLGGTFKANVGWMDAEADQVFIAGQKIDDTDRIAVALGYVYSLSKRTQLYTGAGWVKDSSNVNKDTDPTATEFLAGIMHRF